MPHLKPTRGKFLPKPDGSPEGCLIASLIGCWLMNEGSGDRIFDLSGNGNIGTFGSGAARPFWQGGKSGSSVYFDGGDKISGPSLGSLSLPLTIVASIRRSATGAWDPIFVTHEVNDNYYGAALVIQSSDRVWLQYGDGEGNGSDDRNTKNGVSSLAANRWYTIAGVIRGQNDMDIYLDGVDDAGSYSGTATTMDTSSGMPALGRWPALATDQYLTGNIEYVYLFNRALSASEIALLNREPFCMFSGAGRPPLIGGQIVNLTGASTGLSSLSATTKTIRKTKGTITGFTAVDGLLGITGEEPPDIEMSWRREALFNGMTANAFKLGTALSLGWFWARITGCSALYRGYNMDEIDFANILAVAEHDDSEISPPGYISHSSGSTYFYIIRRFNSCGYQERTLAAAVKFSIGSNGEPAEPKPNKVFDSISWPVDGSKIRLVWFYCPIEQKSQPVCFNIYYDSRTGQIDYQNPLAKIDYKGRKLYSFQSGTLETGKYLFAIRAEDASGLENSSLAQLKIQLDTINLNAINIVRVEAV
ncbi:MAG: LamG domain-containing protein [Planctomycetes bacterium]|nr:LamG domain-containing protein [Planctomycetota bacterium]